MLILAALQGQEVSPEFQQLAYFDYFLPTICKLCRRMPQFVNSNCLLEGEFVAPQKNPIPGLVQAAGLICAAFALRLRA